MNKFVEAIRRLLLIITWLPTTIFVGYILRMRLHENSSVKKMKTSGVFTEDEYKQIVVSSSVNLVGYGEGIIHYSCIPISE